jgi:hypothetical protein
MTEEYNRGRRRDLVGFAMDLVDTANHIAELAEREVAPYVGPPVARQVAEVIEARRIRDRMFHMTLTHPAWTFLLDLYRARLDPEGEPVEWEGVRAHIPLDRLRSIAIIKFDGDRMQLTDFGARLMEQQFKAEKLALQLLA